MAKTTDTSADVTKDAVAEQDAAAADAAESAQAEAVQAGPVQDAPAQPERELTRGERAELAAQNRNYRKTRRGYVTSDKMEKTITVLVEDRVKHSLYGKVLRRSTKVKAHDEKNIAGVGDLVLIAETRPLSATKRWRLVEILEKAK